jgi:polyferredoxin
MKNSKKSTMSTARAIVQIAMLVVIIGGASLRNLLPSDNALVRLWPELQGFCPFGAVQTIFRGMFDASTLLRTDYSNQWVLLGVLAITLLFGAVFCSTLCPLGTVQEWIGKLGKRLKN